MADATILNETYCSPRERLNADNIGDTALRLAEYIHEQQPDYIVALDTGARLLGLATFYAHKEMYGRLPTKDGTLRFMDISARDGSDVEEHLKPLARKMVREGARKVLLLDDVAASGRTLYLAEEVLQKLTKNSVKTKTAVAGIYHDEYDQDYGGSVNVDFIAKKSLWEDPEWTDNSTLIGIEYEHGPLEKPRLFRTEKPREYRKKIIANVREHVRKEAHKTVAAVT